MNLLVAIDFYQIDFYQLKYEANERKIVFENSQVPKLQVLWASQQQPHHKCRGNPLLSILTNARKPSCRDYQ